MGIYLIKMILIRCL